MQKEQTKVDMEGARDDIFLRIIWVWFMQTIHSSPLWYNN